MRLGRRLSYKGAVSRRAVDYRRLRPSCAITIDGCHEAVSAFGKCLDEMRLLRGIVQCLAKAVHGLVQSQIEIDESAGRPKSLDQFLTADHFAGALEQSRQNLKR